MRQGELQRKQTSGEQKKCIFIFIQCISDGTLDNYLELIKSMQCILLTGFMSNKFGQYNWLNCD